MKLDAGPTDDPAGRAGARRFSAWHDVVVPYAAIAMMALVLGIVVNMDLGRYEGVASMPFTPDRSARLLASYAAAHFITLCVAMPLGLLVSPRVRAGVLLAVALALLGGALWSFPPGHENGVMLHVVIAGSLLGWAALYAWRQWVLPAAAAPRAATPP